jgi:hypothetical protein
MAFALSRGKVRILRTFFFLFFSQTLTGSMFGEAFRGKKFAFCELSNDMFRRSSLGGPYAVRGRAESFGSELRRSVVPCSDSFVTFASLGYKVRAASY